MYARRAVVNNLKISITLGNDGREENIEFSGDMRDVNHFGLSDPNDVVSTMYVNDFGAVDNLAVVVRGCSIYDRAINAIGGSFAGDAIRQ